MVTMMAPDPPDQPALAPPPPYPADDVLLELGRLVWAAVLLEDAAAGVCQSAIGAGIAVRSAPVGKQIDATLKIIEAWPQTPARDAGIDWLGRAKAALEARHRLLHATPVVMYRQGAAGPPEELPGVWLQYIPRVDHKDRKGAGPPGTAHPPVQVTVEELLRVHELLATVRQEWTAVSTGLFVIQQERWKAGLIDRSQLTRVNDHRYG